MKKLVILIVASLSIISCATNNSSANNGISTYNNQPDSPTVGSKAASSVEFPEENQNGNITY